MKKYVFLLTALLVFVNVFSQVVLTYKNNAPLLGDTIITQGIELIEPGNPGANQVWDFSKIQLTGESNVSFLSGEPLKPIAGLSDFDATLSEKGYEYFYKMDQYSSSIVGLNIKDLSVVFSDPVVKMKYPVYYGTGFKDEFSGTGTDKFDSGIGLSGNYSFKADAYGTLMLHDRIIKGVLRLKTEEKKIQVNPCGIYESLITSYYWYAPQARYPVLGLSTREVKTNGKEPVVTTSAYMNRKMANTGLRTAGSEDDGLNEDEVSLVLYPNPFVGKLTYNYFLHKQFPVTIELVDMTGKTVITMTSEEVQSEGFHTGELDAVKHDLKMGVYYFRIKCGDRATVSKVVKM